jgi:hypothetical protein
MGVSTTLAQASGIPETIWAALLFLTGFYFLRRESLDATIASALLIGGINIGLILILSIFALPYVRAENLLFVDVPFLNGRPFTPTLFQLIFGVVLLAYFGHTSVGNMAKVVLRRDPSGRALLLGNVAAMVTAMALYALWVVAINGSISPATLASTSGTVLIPLAAVAGSGVYLFGSVFVVLGMGMSSIHYSLALFNQVREWLPNLPRSVALQALAPGLQASPGIAQRLREMLLGKEGRFWISVMPVIIIFLWIEWLLLTDQESFTGPLAFLGVITVPILAGIFPMLMLAASRRKGEHVPGLFWRFLGHPLVVGCLYLIFLAGLFLHGFAIWQNPWHRIAAVGVGTLMTVVIFVFIRQGAFTRRTVVEVQVDQHTGGQAAFTIVEMGKPLPVDITIHYHDNEQSLHAASGEVPHFNDLHSVSFQLPATPAKELKVWLHRLTQEGDSEGIPAHVKIKCGDQAQTVTLSPAQKQVVLPLKSRPCQVEIAIDKPSRKDLLSSLKFVD